MTFTERVGYRASLKDLTERYRWLYGDQMKRWADNSPDLAKWTKLIRRTR